MIIYLFNEKVFNKLLLPLKINGMYSLNLNDRFLLNIFENGGKWNIRLDDSVSFTNNTENELKEYFIYQLKDSITNSIYHMIAAPIYDENKIKLQTSKQEIVISNNDSCDISYSENINNFTDISLVKEQNYWKLKTENNNVFVNDTMVKECNFYQGDFLFFYGLRLFFVGNEIVINNPNNLVKYNPNSFTIYNEEIKEEEIDMLTNVMDDTPLYSKDDYFFRSPRFNSNVITEEVTIGAPPAIMEENANSPLWLTLGPQITMLSTSVITLITYVTGYINGETDGKRFALSFVTIATTIAGTLLWPMFTKRYSKKQAERISQRNQEKYIKYLEGKKAYLVNVKNKQKQIISENAISLDNCKVIIDAKSQGLWQRNLTDDDFLKLRLGIGTIPTRIKMQLPDDVFSLDEKDRLSACLQTVIDESKVILDAPLTFSLTDNFITAVVGPEAMAKSIVDGFLLQIMTLHSYTELKIVVFSEKKQHWNYLKILPHCWDNSKTKRYYAGNLEEMTEISIGLEKIFDGRVGNAEAEVVEDDGGGAKAPYTIHKPYYLIFTDDIVTIRNVSLIKKILHYKINVGFSLLMLNDKLSTLPSETTAFINISDPLSLLISNDVSENNQVKFKAEYPTNVNLYECAQKLANIPIQTEKEKYELPASLSFLEMFGVGKVEQLNSLERWANNNPVNSLSVPVGIDQNGELFKMDIHEKAYGPHGLVAGTTGSGKSEWIVTYILSLAVNFHPDEVQFVLIDYKGGGLAGTFENKEMGLKLPHLAGTITNLDKSEVNRAIASIESELKRRQAIFNDAREKLKEGSMNIYKYQQYYRKKLVDIPLSHLLIICDEFAELKSQQPEFMDQLISTSRIGRSLGVHLILATQKPSGVVNEQIWSNSRFKVCLKVQDKGDSQEMLKKPDAAYLKQTGAFYLQVGTDEYYNLGQSAWAGAKYYPSDAVKKKIDQSVQYINNLGTVVDEYDTDSEIAVGECKGEELINIFEYICNVSKEEEVKSMPLWLEQIPPVIYLSQIKKQYNYTAVPGSFNTVIGVYDEPRMQTQNLLKIDISKGNIGIVGGVGTGKENLISTIIWSSIIEHSPKDLAYYIIDFGAEIMKKFSKFPHVGEVVFQDEMDKVAGILDLIIEELDRRKQLFSDYNGSFEFYNKNSGQKLPLIVLVINAYDVFDEMVPKATAIIDDLFRDAPKYGIIFIVSGSSQSTLRSRQLQYFNHLIVTQFQDDSLYRTLTDCRRGLIPKKTFGRGICKLGSTVDSYCEFQTANIIESEKEYQFLKESAEKLIDYYKFKVKQLAKIPDNVTSKDLVKYITDLSSVPLGYNFYEKDIAKYDLLSEKIHLVSGKNIVNNIKFFYALANVLLNVPKVKVRLVDFLNIFKEPIIDLKYFNNNYDVVIGALLNDVKTREENQDIAINIMLGAGNIKSRLSEAGLLLYNEMMKNVVQSKSIIFIFVDNYDKLRTLKLEEWFSTVNNSNGIWLGPGVGNQSLINCNDLTAEDKKYDYPGLAYTIKDGQYTIIKTAMDGEDI